MNDLTEKWKSGELEKGKIYWCKVENEGILLCYLWLQDNKFTCLQGYQNKYVFNDTILEVLARCDYEELQSLKEENARLKKWLEFIATMQWGELKDCKNYAKQALNGSEVMK